VLDVVVAVVEQDEVAVVAVALHKVALRLRLQAAC
jgi:hypothetical protein